MNSRADEIERLRRLLEMSYPEQHAEIERLRAALEPFARNVNSLSLSGALGHITREDLWRARDALKRS
jgi:hypothetical protein